MVLETRTTFICDDKIAPYIIELNRKGYTTDYCCSGHSDKGELVREPYISFTRIPSMKLKKLGTPPNNWTYYYQENYLLMRRNYTREELDIFTIDQMIDKSMQELSNWIDKLEPLKYLIGGDRVSFEIKKL